LLSSRVFETVAMGGASVIGGYIRSGTIEVVHQKFDLVVVGGGISGTCAAISAARNGVDVALIHETSYSKYFSGKTRQSPE